MEESERHGNACRCCHHGKGVEESLDEVAFQKSLAKAAHVGDVGRMRELIRKGAHVDGHEATGYTPLHYAARNGHVEACLLLLQSGAQVNKRTRAGNATCLHRAAYAGHWEIVKLLLEAGADACAKDADGRTPLQMAVTQGHSRVVTLLMDTHPKHNPCL